MTRPLLLITGSRRFVRTGEDWCRERILEVLRPMPLETIVLHGGADGPDTWADEYARAYGLATVRYYASGRIEAHGVECREQWKPIEGVTRQSYLLRDDFMVHSARLYLLSGRGPVACVGFRHPEAKTHGTEYTLKRARQAGLWTEERVYSGA